VSLDPTELAAFAAVAQAARVASHATETAHEADTAALGSALGGVIARHAVVALDGPLGAGKTAFVRGLAAGLGAAPDQPVTSPTYALVHAIPLASGEDLIHADLYRLDDDPDALEALGFRDWLVHARCIALEWADNVAEASQAATVRVRIDDLGGERRRVTITRRA
jgi:tRNA threonylcarbamoyladenosine biosynthesis protein TsaE